MADDDREPNAENPSSFSNASLATEQAWARAKEDREGAADVKKRLEQAAAELEHCQSAIGSYDEILFKIRSWNIAFSALLIAAIFGVNSQDMLKHSTASLLLATHMMVTACFWFMDGLNKSIQAKYIEVCQHIEGFLRGDRRIKYLGPSLTLRFSRRERRHMVSIVKNISEDSIWPFYWFPIGVFWISIFWAILSNQRDLCFSLEPPCELPGFGPISAGACLLLLAGLFLLSKAWNVDLASRSVGFPTDDPKLAEQAKPAQEFAFERSQHFFRAKYYFRYTLLIRSKLISKINDRLFDIPRSGSPNPDHLIDKTHRGEKYHLGPFSPEYFNEDRNTVVFIDRYRVCINKSYINRRNDVLTKRKYTVVRTEWRERMGFWARLVFNIPLPTYPRWVFDTWEIWLVRDSYESLHSPVSPLLLAILKVNRDVLTEQRTPEFEKFSHAMFHHLGKTRRRPRPYGEPDLDGEMADDDGDPIQP